MRYLARYLLALAQLSRLMHYDFDLKVSMDAFIAKQDKDEQVSRLDSRRQSSEDRANLGEGLTLTSSMAYHDISGDPRALTRHAISGDWYQHYLDNGDLTATDYFAGENKFSRVGGVVGHLGKGAPSRMMWLYWRTRTRSIWTSRSRWRS